MSPKTVLYGTVLINITGLMLQFSLERAGNGGGGVYNSAGRQIALFKHDGVLARDSLRIRPIAYVGFCLKMGG